MTITTESSNRGRKTYSMEEEKSFFETLRFFLHGLINLESLHLSLAKLPLKGRMRASLACRDGLGSGRIWPKLQKLSLGHFNFSEAHLRDLLLSHSETLTNLRLGCIDFPVWGRDNLGPEVCMPATLIAIWTDFLDALRTGLSLEHVELWGYLGCSWYGPHPGPDGGPDSDIGAWWEPSKDGLAEALFNHLVHGADVSLEYRMWVKDEEDGK